MTIPSKTNDYEQAKSLALVLLKSHSIPTLEQIEASVQRVLTIYDEPESIDTRMLVREIQSSVNCWIPTNSEQKGEETFYKDKFEMGKQYRRRDIYRIIGISEDTKGGNWDTGYSSFGNDWFIFWGL